MKNYISIEQSKKLMELGLDINTADMFYNLDESHNGSVDDFKYAAFEMICWLLENEEI